MNTVEIVPKCKVCGKHYTIFSVSVSHEGIHCNLYLECLCVVCGKENTIQWSFEQLSFYAMKLLDERSNDVEETETKDKLFKMPTDGSVN